MTFTKEEVYKDVQILNPGPGDRDKNAHQRTGTKDEKHGGVACWTQRSLQRIATAQVCPMLLLSQV